MTGSIGRQPAIQTAPTPPICSPPDAPGLRRSAKLHWAFKLSPAHPAHHRDGLQAARKSTSTRAPLASIARASAPTPAVAPLTHQPLHTCAASHTSTAGSKRCGGGRLLYLHTDTAACAAPLKMAYSTQVGKHAGSHNRTIAAIEVGQIVQS